MTWAVIHHALSMYESIDLTKDWAPMLLLMEAPDNDKKQRNGTISIRGHTYVAFCAWTRLPRAMLINIFSTDRRCAPALRTDIHLCKMADLAFAV